MEQAIKHEEIAINTVITVEVAHFLIKNLGPVIGTEKMSTFLSFPFRVVNLDHGLAVKSIELLAKYSHYGIGGRDATILATAQSLSLRRLMSHDSAFKRIDWLDVIDPVSRS